MAARGANLDVPYVTGWLGRLLPPDDPRLPRIATLLDPQP